MVGAVVQSFVIILITYFALMNFQCTRKITVTARRWKISKIVIPIPNMWISFLHPDHKMLVIIIYVIYTAKESPGNHMVIILVVSVNIQQFFL